MAILFASIKFCENLKEIFLDKATFSGCQSFIPLFFFSLSSKCCYCSNSTENFLCHGTCLGKGFDFFDCVISYNLKNKQSTENPLSDYQRTRIVMLNERTVKGLSTINVNDNLHPLQENNQTEQIQINEILPVTKA